MLFLALDLLVWVRPPGFDSFRYGRCLAAPALLFCIVNRTVRSCFTWNVALGENAMKRTSMVVLAVVLGISVAAGAAGGDGRGRRQQGRIAGGVQRGPRTPRGTARPERKEARNHRGSPR